MEDNATKGIRMMVSEENKRLYHYTTWDGLVGILKSQSLWATHHTFLNDYMETLLMKDKLIELARPIVHEESLKILNGHPDRKQIMKKMDINGGFETIVNHDSDILITGMYESLPNYDGLYITSFCGESKDEYINANGLLSQWRGYGQGGGFALVFNTQGLERMLAEESERFDYCYGRLSDVIYSEDEETFRSEFAYQLSDMREYIGAMIKCVHNRVLDSTVNNKNSFPAFVSCISRYKHRGFREENEVRICAYPTVHDEEYLSLHKSDNNHLKPEKERKLYKKNGEFVPYIELFDSLDKDLPIEQIIVGPHQNKKTRVSVLRVMLRGTNIEVNASDIPFIG